MFDVFVNVFCFKSKIFIKFVCRFNEWSSELSSSWAVGIFAVAAPETTLGDTPLHDAARGGFLKVADLLLSNGAAVDATNNGGAGPQSGKQGENPVSRLGAPQKGFFPGLKFDKKCLHFQQAFGKVVSFQCDMPICVESTWFDLQMEHKLQDGQLSRMLQSLRLPVGSRIQLDTHIMNMCFLAKRFETSVKFWPNRGFDTKF